MATADKYYKFKALPDDILTRLQQLPLYLAQSDVLLAYLFGSLAQAGKGQDREEFAYALSYVNTSRSIWSPTSS